MNAYVLHFDHHRVREKSVKNFKLVRQVPDESKPAGATKQVTVLQFGRVADRNIFVCDYAYPLSPLAAFAICLSSIDPKLSV
jgi:tubby-related protein 1